MSTSRLPSPRALALSTWRVVRRHWIASLALFFAVGGGGTVALAASSSASRTYYACVASGSRSLSLTSKGATCPRGARKISFSARGTRGLQGEAGRRGADGAGGPAGADGPAGPVGAPGLTGGDGATGSTGQDGARGRQGETGPRGLQGVTGADGATGAKGDTGAKGADGAKGDTGAPGAPGAAGATGATGPSGGGLTLTDKNGVSLGKVVAVGRQSVSVITSTGYNVAVPFDGQFSPAQIYYTGACGSAASVGTGYLNTGNGANGGNDPIWGRSVAYSGSLGSLVVPATVDATTGTAQSENLTSASIDNPTCRASAGTVNGWKLKTITNAAAGLPATIATPLSIG